MNKSKDILCQDCLGRFPPMEYFLGVPEYRIIHTYRDYTREPYQVFNEVGIRYVRECIHCKCREESETPKFIYSEPKIPYGNTLPVHNAITTLNYVRELIKEAQKKR